MGQIFNYSHPKVQHNENSKISYLEFSTIDNYRRQCSYIHDNYKDYEKQFNEKFLLTSVDHFSDSHSVSGEINLYITDISDIPYEPYAIISANFIDNNKFDNNLYDVNNGFLVDNFFLKFKGPTLYSECEIYDLKVDENCDREFGYIQTLKIFIEREYEKGISYADFQSNLLHNQEEVLDIYYDGSGDIPHKPFYSPQSFFKLAANDSSLSGPIKIELHDRPCRFIYSRNLESELLFGRLESHKIYFQFCDYVVMRSKRNDEEKWESPVVLFSFDWFIYSDWRREFQGNNNQYKYNYGVNWHRSKKESLPNLNDTYICNRDEFQYSMSIENNKLHMNIYKYPTYCSEELKLLERFKNAVLVRNYEEKLKENEVK